MDIALKAAFARRIRRAGLIGFVDQLLGGADVIRSLRGRRLFRRDHPGVVLPPSGIAYDAFGPFSPSQYWTQGHEHAAYIASLIERYRPIAGVICEWGCGPMRVLRHISEFFPAARLIGLDRNAQTIAWCTDNFRPIGFALNGAAPPLPLKDGQADVIYVISVFTHLSEASHTAFANDLMRCLAPGGILIVTTHGDRFVHKLTPEERAKYGRGDLVVRDKVTEGKRTFVAFQSPKFVRKLFGGSTILEHDVADRIEDHVQDTWVIQKTSA